MASVCMLQISSFAQAVDPIRLGKSSVQSYRIWMAHRKYFCGCFFQTALSVIQRKVCGSVCALIGDNLAAHGSNNVLKASKKYNIKLISSP